MTLGSLKFPYYIFSVKKNIYLYEIPNIDFMTYTLVKPFPALTRLRRVATTDHNFSPALISIPTNRETPSIIILDNIEVVRQSSSQQSAIQRSKTVEHPRPSVDVQGDGYSCPNCFERQCIPRRHCICVYLCYPERLGSNSITSHAWMDCNPTDTDKGRWNQEVYH